MDEEEKKRSHAEAQKKYFNSDKGKEAQFRYDRTEKRRENRRKADRKRSQTPERKEYLRRKQREYRAKMKAKKANGDSQLLPE